MLKIALFLFPLSLFSLNFKVASYNVENLFDMTYNGTEYGEYIPSKHGWNRKIFIKKLLNISEVICEINADIIGLQEIENDNALKQLQSSLRKIGCLYQYSAITHKKASAVQVALLSKFPIESKKDIIVKRGFNDRNILEVKYRIKNNPFFIYVNHWKSKASKESRRMLSAKALLKRVQRLPKGSEYILLGDFNSDYNEYQKMQKRHNDTLGRTGINHLLKTMNKEGLLRPSCLKKNSLEHTNLWLSLENYKRWSHNFYGDKQALDSIILPYSLFDGQGIDYVKNSFHLFKKSYLFHKKGYVFRWEYKHKRHQGRGYSDHLPIVASFSTKPFKREACAIHQGSIQSLSGQEPLFPMRLKRVKVISVARNKVLLQSSHSKDTISLYGTQNSLKLGQLYDIRVYKRKLYQGHYEIIDFELEKRYDFEITKKD